jgi:hypothetical protein
LQDPVLVIYRKIKQSYETPGVGNKGRGHVG